MLQVNRIIETPDGPVPISGFVAESFGGVSDAFAQNFSLGLELGASLAIHRHGDLIVDLWGGYADTERRHPWERETLCTTMSVSKAVTAVCLLMLADRGLVDLEAPIAAYWPEFAANGKASIKLRWLLDHRAGLPVVTDPLWRGAIFDWDAMVDALGRQSPLVQPGTTPAYHIRTFGFLIGEVVRRVTGRSLGQFFREEVALPCGIDFHIGLSDSEMARCATLVPPAEAPAPTDPRSLVALAGLQMPVPMDYNTPQYRRAEIPSSNGHGNGRSVSRFYAMLAAGGLIAGRRVLGPDILQFARTEQHFQPEAVMGRQYRQGLGFLLNSPEIFDIGPNPEAFGLNGAGGALGMADPEAGLAFGYVENKMHSGLGLGVRSPRLIRALYAALAS